MAVEEVWEGADVAQEVATEAVLVVVEAEAADLEEAARVVAARAEEEVAVMAKEAAMAAAAAG